MSKKKELAVVLAKRIENNNKLYKKFLKNPEKVVRNLAKKKRFQVEEDKLENLVESIKKKVDVDDVKLLINQLKDKIDIDDAKEIYAELKEKIETAQEEVVEKVEEIKKVNPDIKTFVLQTLPKLFKKR